MQSVRPDEATEARAGAQPLVSVVIPVYNHASVVGACLDSVHADPYPAIEVIVIDDGSSDESFSVIQAWRDQHPSAFLRFLALRQENCGITRTLNRLIALAAGEFVVPVASDDYLLPGGIEARLEALSAHPEWLAVIGDCKYVDWENRPMASSGIEWNGGCKRALLNPRLIATEIILRWSIPGPVLMTRKRAYDPQSGIGGYNESMEVEDRDLYLRLLAREALGFIDHTVAAYRWRPHDWQSPRLLRLVEADAMCELGFARSFRGLPRWGLRVKATRMLVILRARRAGLPRILRGLVRVVFGAAYEALLLVHRMRCFFGVQRSRGADRSDAL